jgi:uncharacterized membrane protein
MTKTNTFLHKHGWLLVILLVAFVMRIAHLTTQSLWLDELHTMNEAGPNTSWNELFRYLRTSDQHPPLHFLAEKLAFTLFGHTEFVARLVSVIAGTLSVWAMYFLGKTLLSQRLGTIAAILTCVNFYNISYSQEARAYIFAFLFAALSFAFFIRLVRTPARKEAILYAVFTTCLLYSHYYSLFIVLAQGMVGLLFIFQERGKERKALFVHFLISAGIMLLAYAPWIPFMLKMSGIKSFWISNIPLTFQEDFFYEYFGNADILKPLLLLLLFVYVMRVSMHPGSIIKISESPLLLGFVLIVTSFFVTLLIPYIRSLQVVPMLYPRYTIVALPGILLLLAYSFELFNHATVRNLLVGLFVVLSLTYLLVVRKYYTSISKSQFREMTSYVVKENTSNFPIINQVTAWHQQYYLDKFGSKAEVWSGQKESLIDSIVKKSSPKYDLQGFWIVGAHGDKMPDENAIRSLDSSYMLLKSATYHDAWAQLYVSKDHNKAQYIILSYDDFSSTEGAKQPEMKRIAIWNGTVTGKPVFLSKGTYKLSIQAMGTKAKNEFPHLNVFCNDRKLGDYFVPGEMESRDFDLTQENDGDVVLELVFDNDAYNPPGEDRNIFLSSIIITRTDSVKE